MHERKLSESLEKFFSVAGVLLIQALQILWFITKWFFIITFWSLGITIFIIGFLNAIVNGKPMPEYRSFQRPKRPKLFQQPNHPEFDPNQFRGEFPHLHVGDVLKEFEDKLKQMEYQGQLNAEQKQVVHKLRQFDRSKYSDRVGDVFEDDELEELLLIILILLGVEVV